MALDQTKSGQIIPDERGADDSIYLEDGAVRPELLEALEVAIRSEGQDDVSAIVQPLHESELGDLIEDLKPELRPRLVEIMGDEFDFASLTEVEDGIRKEMLGELDNDIVAEAVQELESDDAVYILEDMEDADREAVLSLLSLVDQSKIRRSLDYPEETAGRRMQTECIAVPPFWTVGQTIDYMRQAKHLPESFTQIFVVDPSFKLIGAIALDRILRAKRPVLIEQVMHETRHAIPALMDQEEAAMVFEQYDLLSAAVVDESEKLVGVLTIDDVVDVIQQEAEEDIKRLVGIGDEELSDDVFRTARSRFVWLVVNLATSVLASIVIGLFEATISEMVALAVLMPIVASMGGNAGTQTMTVAVRALATRDLDSGNKRRILMRELAVGLLNGLAFAVLMAIVAVVWFSSPGLGLIIAIAMVFNMVCAAFAGMIVPIVLDKAGADPAIASSVFVTTVTDIVGFFAFLGLAAVYLV
ncbi:MAG: magnesium transporter [Pseudomonadota bacterium]